DGVGRVIMARFPDHAFLGEEPVAATVAPTTAELIWVVDPLDGTTNYVHGYPNFAVSVAIARGGDVQAGVIYDPIRDQCFAAALGRVAYYNGVPVKRSEVTA